MLDTGGMHGRSHVLLQAGLLLALAGVCAVISNATAGASRHLPWSGRPAASGAQVPPAPGAADPAQPVREASPEDAWALYRSGAPFLDARRSAAYAEGHVAGAWSLPVWEDAIEARITAFEALAKPASTSPLVIYCDGGDCADSRLLADRLIPLGYRNLRLYMAGYPDWARQGRPVRKGAQR